MKLWHAWVGNGRFIVRAESQEQAIELARGEAKKYSSRDEDALTDSAGAEHLSPDGPAAVLDVDYS
jgi:hypothetical protein